MLLPMLLLLLLLLLQEVKSDVFRGFGGFKVELTLRLGL